MDKNIFKHLNSDILYPNIFNIVSSVLMKKGKKKVSDKAVSYVFNKLLRSKELNSYIKEKEAQSIKLFKKSRKDRLAAQHDLSRKGGKLVRLPLKKEEKIDFGLYSSNYTYLISTIKSSRPVIETRSIRLGSSQVRFPTEMKVSKQYSLLMKYLLVSCKGSSNKNLKDKLFTEVLNLLKNQGTVIDKVRMLHQESVKNRLFTNYRW